MLKAMHPMLDEELELAGKRIGGRRWLARGPLAVLAVLLLAAPVAADGWMIHLTNGNSFVAKYQPREAEYDSSKWLIMTDVGNTIAIAKTDVAEVVNDLEFQGFGLVIDTSTIMVGLTANDAPDPEALAQLGATGSAGSQFAAPADFGAEAAPVYNTQQFAEPNQGGGIPLSMIGGGLFSTSVPQGAVPPN